MSNVLVAPSLPAVAPSPVAGVLAPGASVAEAPAGDVAVPAPGDDAVPAAGDVAVLAGGGGVAAVVGGGPRHHEREHCDHQRDGGGAEHGRALAIHAPL